MSASDLVFVVCWVLIVTVEKLVAIVKLHGHQKEEIGTSSVEANVKNKMELLSDVYVVVKL